MMVGSFRLLRSRHSTHLTSMSFFIGFTLGFFRQMALLFLIMVSFIPLVG